MHIRYPKTSRQQTDHDESKEQNQAGLDHARATSTNQQISKISVTWPQSVRVHEDLDQAHTISTNISVNCTLAFGLSNSSA